MPEISITNSKGRDAQVMAESVRVPVHVRWVDGSGRQSTSVRLMKGTIDRDYDALLAKFGTPEDVASALISSDPEVDLESCGAFLKDTSRVYFNVDREIVHSIVENEIVRNPDGSEKARRPKKRPAPNVSPDQPLPWTGRMLAKKDVYNKFAMVAKMQLVHINGLTYDFLFGMAKELEAKDSLLVVGTGPKGNQPIVLRHGGLPYRGFLEGRTKGDEYCLLLHLSNLEIKAPDVKPAEGKSE
ncbi:hypothetical protein BH11PLA2_BH11PLA2_46160 [soil metagenome]